MSYDKYKIARDTAWRVLINNRITSFPINIVSLLYSQNIATYPTTDITAYATTYTINGIKAIRYNPNCTDQQLRFTLAHELGHILLDHLFLNLPEHQEMQANVFASRLLMPAIVIHENKLFTTQAISDFFGVSLEAAQIRADRIQLLENRNAFYFHPLEQKYAEIYKNRPKNP